MTRAPRMRQTAELDLFRLYLDEIGRHALLTRQDETELSQAHHAGLRAQQSSPRPTLMTPPARSWSRRPPGGSGRGAR